MISLSKLFPILAFRKFVRGFAIGSSGIAFCDDNGQITKISLENLKNTNLSSSGKSLIIGGKCITIGDSASTIADKLILIKKELSVQDKKVTHVKIARLSEELWYLGYEGEVLGPFSKEKLQEEVTSNKYIIDALQVWTSSFSEWKMVSEIDLFDSIKNEKNISLVMLL